MSQFYQRGDKVRSPMHIYRLVCELLVLLKTEKRSFFFLLFLTIISATATLVPPRIFGFIIDSIFLSKNLSFDERKIYLAIFCATAIALYAILFLTTIIKVRFNANFSQSFIFSIRKFIFNRLQFMNIRFYEQRKSGELLNHIVNDTEQIGYFLFSSAVSLILSFFIFVGAFVMLFLIDIHLTLVMLITLFFLMVTVFSVTRFLRNLWKKIRRLQDELFSFINERLSGVWVTKIFLREKLECERFERLAIDFSETYSKYETAFGSFTSVIHFITLFSTVVIIFVGGLRCVQSDATLKVGELISFLVYTALIYNSATEISRANFVMQNIALSIERIFSILDVKSEIEEDSQKLEIPQPIRNIKFRNVRFGYEENKLVLDGVNFEIREKDVINITGASGSGKSTLAKLICAIYLQHAGNILYDEVDLKDLKRSSVRSFIKLVMQEDFLFNDSIKNNIMYGADDVSEDEYNEVCRVCRVDEIIREKEKSLVGMNGSNLSAGQKQRVVLARAVISKPKILILDEALSYLDSRTECEILQYVVRMLKDSIIIIISNRVQYLEGIFTKKIGVRS